MKCFKHVQRLLNDSCLIGHIAASILLAGDKSSWRKRSRQGCICKVQIVCVQSNPVNPRHTTSTWYYSWMFVPRSHIHYIFITTIFIISQRCLLPSLNLILLRVKPVVSLQKSNLPPLLMGCDIALIVPGAAATASACGKQAVDTLLLLCQPFIFKETASKWVLSIYSVFCRGFQHWISICRGGELSTLCSWSPMIQLSCAWCMHVYLFVDQP